MDYLRAQQLKEHVNTQLRTILTEGDVAYLQRLSREDLLRALEHELYFLGLYSAQDLETKAVVHTCLVQALNEWVQAHLHTSAFA